MKIIETLLKVIETLLSAASYVSRFVGMLIALACLAQPLLMLILFILTFTIIFAF